MAEARDVLEYVRKNPEKFTPPHQKLDKADFLDTIFKDAEKRLLPAVFPLFVKIYELGQNDEAQAVTHEDITVHGKYAQRYAERASAEMVTRINDTTKKELRELFAQEWRAGSSLATMTGKIQEKFTNFNAYRSALIATQETSMAYENGKTDMFADLARREGVTGWKKAITQQDDSVRDSHRQNARDGWIPNNEPFSGTGHLAPPF